MNIETYKQRLLAKERELGGEIARLKTDAVESRTLVTVRRYRDLTEAMVARGALESAGIFCFLRDENVVRMDWAYSNAVGGIILQVSAEDLEEATALLNQPMPQSIPVEGEADYTQPVCPRCGSTDISFEGAGRKAAMISVFTVGLPLPLGVESWLCHACDARWTDDEDDSPAPDGGKG